ncbi:hypothetical protein Vadar_021344 [Vaccinium darrowii]|uniref:Uncharacterized protein n=1 Tax=Vaccinium darrowii TaxID=229202 RepID=A0ACB7XK58_9ERIC|nr:hypothetical protein Vadar_021344 [Vaccinium darrowii]
MMEKGFFNLLKAEAEARERSAVSSGQAPSGDNYVGSEKDWYFEGTYEEKRGNGARWREKPRWKLSLQKPRAVFQQRGKQRGGANRVGERRRRRKPLREPRGLSWSNKGKMKNCLKNKKQKTSEQSELPKSLRFGSKKDC